MVIIVLLLLLVAPLSARAEVFKVAPGIELSLALPGPDWKFSATPPEFLVKETAAHVKHHLDEQHKEAPVDLAERIAEQLRRNELFLVRPSTSARLLVDFSPDNPGAQAPTQDILHNSARAAASELRNEPDLSQVKTEVTPGTLTGAGQVWQLEASYLQDGKPRRFFGVIGFVGGSWLFLYYTDLNRDAGDLAAVRKALEGASVTLR